VVGDSVAIVSNATFGIRIRHASFASASNVLRLRRGGDGGDRPAGAATPAVDQAVWAL
jgi:hypothetical protein